MRWVDGFYVLSFFAALIGMVLFILAMPFTDIDYYPHSNTACITRQEKWSLDYNSKQKTCYQLEQIE